MRTAFESVSRSGYCAVFSSNVGACVGFLVSKLLTHPSLQAIRNDTVSSGYAFICYDGVFTHFDKIMFENISCILRFLMPLFFVCLVLYPIIFIFLFYCQARFKTHCVDLRDEGLLKVHADNDYLGYQEDALGTCFSTTTFPSVSLYFFHEKCISSCQIFPEFQA